MDQAVVECAGEGHEVGVGVVVPCRLELFLGQRLLGRAHLGELELALTQRLAQLLDALWICDHFTCSIVSE